MGISPEKNNRYIITEVKIFLKPQSFQPRFKDDWGRGVVFPDGRGAKTVLPRQGTQVRSLVRELNPTCCNEDLAQPNK